MINQVYQLVAPRQINVAFHDLSLAGENVIVRPKHLSICAADQRYFTGTRDRRVMERKLPMALIHEAWGEVVSDGRGELAPGTKVLLVPNTPREQDNFIGENYLPSSRFRASGFDGFMQEYVSMERDRVVPFENIIPEVAALSELISVAMHAVRSFMASAHGRRDAIGVWGDGNLGYLTCLLVKMLMPETKVYIFGMSPDKLNYFSFADAVYDVASMDGHVEIDHAFECVGGGGSEYAIDQIIDCIHPEGTIVLMGVSENNVPIRTRMVLEKGLRLMGRSRSGREDFLYTARYLQDNPEMQHRIKKIIREVIPVKNVADIVGAFESDIHQAFKTVMRWDV